MQTLFEQHLQHHPNIILFDGVCKLCHGWTRFVLRFDHHQRFKLCSVQSPEGAAILQHFGYPTDSFDTMLYVQTGKSFDKSSAFLHIIKQFGFPWFLLSAFFVLPRPLRDWGYDLIARYRYRLFGKYDQCILISPEQATRFLDGTMTCHAAL